MKILVMSDTHDNFSLALHACKQADPFDLLIHIGDGGDDVNILHHVGISAIINVAGNCDVGSTAPREIIWECEGKKLLLTHGDAYGVKSGFSRLEKRALETGVNAVLFGHTHQATHFIENNIVFINPGTLANTGQQKTYAIVEILPTGISVSHHIIP